MGKRWIANVVTGCIGILLTASIITNSIQMPSQIGDINTLYVGGSGENNYTKIQDAINDANNGDKIVVYYGFYNESLTINKTLYIFGLEENGKKPIINGEGSHAVSIFASNCQLKNFTIIMEKCKGKAVDVFSSSVVIEDCIIRCMFNGSYGIYLYNSLYSEVRRNIIYEAYNDGIFLCKSSKCNISKNTFHEVNYYPIHLLNSSENVIYENNVANVGMWSLMLLNSSNNVIKNNIFKKEVEIMYSHNNTIQHNFISSRLKMEETHNNDVSRNKIRGVLYCVSSLYATINDNIFQSGGIWLEGISILHYTTHIIENNMLNGKPIKYYKNEKNLLISCNASQIILANCTHCTIKNVNISGSNRAIQLKLSHNNLISNCILSNNKYAISLKYSHGNIILGNIIHDNKMGVYIENSNETRIMENKIEGNEVALLAYETCDTVIESNTLSKNEKGIWIGNGFHNEISWNNIENNKDGIHLNQAMVNFVMHNNFVENERDTFIENSFTNIFLRNYWSNWGLPLPKPIICHFYIRWVISFRYMIFDWCPALSNK